MNHALWSGDAETGVSLMRITPGLDAGPVLAQSRRPIGSTDTSESLLAELAMDASDLLARHLGELLEGSTTPILQDETQVTLAPKLAKEMAVLDPAQPAAALHRQIRALHPWPGSELRVRDEILKIIEVGAVQPSPAPSQALVWNKSGAWLRAGDGQAVELLRLQRAGKPVQPALQALQPWGNQGEIRLG